MSPEYKGALLFVTILLCVILYCWPTSRLLPLINSSTVNLVKGLPYSEDAQRDYLSNGAFFLYSIYMTGSRREKETWLEFYNKKMLTEHETLHVEEFHDYILSHYSKHRNKYVR